MGRVPYGMVNLTEGPITQRCSTCNEVKELSEFYKDARKPLGVRVRCIQCSKSRIRTRPPPEILDPGLKRCTKCKEVKPYEEFYTIKTIKSGLTPQCKMCHNQATKECNQRHAAKRRAANHEYYIKNKDEIDAKSLK